MQTPSCNDRGNAVRINPVLRRTVAPRVGRVLELPCRQRMSPAEPRNRKTRVMAVASEYRYIRLTWEEMNEAIAAEKVVVLPTGSVEQHGPHLPLGRRHIFGRIGLPRSRPSGGGPRVGLARGSLRTESSPHRFPRHDPHRARDVHRLLPEHHKELGLPRLPENSDRQWSRIEHAAGRCGSPGRLYWPLTRSVPR